MSFLVPKKPQILYAPMLASFGGGSARGFNPGGGGGGLFDFTSHTFTNAGAGGTLGPTLSDLTSEYSSTTWASDSSFFTLDTNYNAQKFTIPQNGTYRIQVRGAAGGPISGQSPAGSNGPGFGYQHRADFSLTEGEFLYIIVGQMGQTVARTGNQAGPGGGGSFVFTENAGDETLLMAGAGGNGGSWENHAVRDPDGREPGAADPSDSAGQGRGTSGAGWKADGANAGGGATGSNAEAIGVGSVNDAKGANYDLSSTNQQNWPLPAGGVTTIGGGFGGGGTGAPYEGGGGGGYKGGFPKKSNDYNNRHLGYGALSYVLFSAANKTNEGLGSAGTHGRVIVTKL
jgi:hypothetical protein